MLARNERLAQQRKAMRIWREANRETARARNRAHYHARPHPYLARVAAKRAHGKEAVPQWLTKEQWREIAETYQRAQQISAMTGIYHVVDHIWPLKGEVSCGLHVPWNLQVITHALNVAKGSREPEQ